MIEWSTTYKEKLITLVSTGLLAQTLFFAFSRQVRAEVKDNADGLCEECGGVGQHAAHFNHSREYEGYDDPDNGRFLCLVHHYLDHYHRTLEDIGLSFEHNAWALSSLWGKLEEWEKVGLPTPESYKEEHQLALL